ncbi:RNA polymerase sigma-70 factor, ECF subfamily [Cognatiyoonia koreensis]|uniref:RNA polymerase sigma factor n=1 Tax=Cognatiyoonia koreensis TaxID=364200 RepID=A0A1I0RXD7_9RHOB|nr:sigma-70 family RNA polymerase sigma factor [Cognatiyoonia koreensis]SEW46217.1 RNA polymerase sigma-70 factor, ECF subfamily [Cognatiyoonia koreensis]
MTHKRKQAKPPDRSDDPKDDIITHLPALRAYALALARNPTLADDLVQDTIVKAWTHMHQFAPGTNMGAWLFRILRNCFFSDLRKRKWEVGNPVGFDLDTLSVKPDHDGRLQLRDFYRAFEQLPFAQRETLALLAGAGYSYDEVAVICGVAPGTIKSRANRARRRLADMLALDESGAVPLTDPITLAIITRR